MRCKDDHSLAERLCGVRDMVVCVEGVFDLYLVDERTGQKGILARRRGRQEQ